jgi:nucleotide-binding universal stress UspA family protein
MHCKRILTVIDFTENSGRLLDFTMELAAKEKAKVCLLHGEPPQTGYAYLTPGPGYSGFVGFGDQVQANEELRSVRLEHEEQAIQMLKERLEKENISTEIKLIVGDQSSDILRVVEDFNADLIIISAHQQSFFADLLLGNTAKDLLKRTPCPLLILPEP